MNIVFVSLSERFPSARDGLEQGGIGIAVQIERLALCEAETLGDLSCLGPPAFHAVALAKNGCTSPPRLLCGSRCEGSAEFAVYGMKLWPCSHQPYDRLPIARVLRGKVTPPSTVKVCAWLSG